MKKMLFALLVASFTALSASAFGDFRIGATAGYNLTQVHYDRATLDKILNGKNGGGWYAGVKARMGLFMGLGLDGSLVYNQREHALTDRTLVSKITYRSLDIPLNARFDLTLGGVGVYVAAGPRFSFNLGDKKWDTSALLDNASLLTPKGSKNATSLTDGVFRRENLVTSLNVGAGLRFSESLEVGATYNMPMTSRGYRLLESVGVHPGVELPSYQANTWSLHATLYF